MKNILRKTSYLFVISLLFSSCTDLSVGEIDSDFYDASSGDLGDPTKNLETNYNDLGAFTDQANIYSLFEHTSDEMLPPTRGVDWGDNGVWRTLHAHTWDPAHSYVTESWNQLNGRAFRCNQTIASGGTTQQTAEARLLRAFYTYHVMDLYGQVPFREVTQGPDEDPIVLSRADAFSYIMDDLDAAYADLPVIGPSAGNYQVSKAAADYLYAKLYLNKAVYLAANPAGPYTFDNADMQKVIDHVDAIEAAGYSLDADYFNIFHPTNSASEVILHSPSGNPANRIYMTTHYSQNPSGWNGFTTMADFYNTVANDPNDQRLGKGPGTTGYVYDAADFPGGNATGMGYGFLIGQQYNDDGTETVDSRTQLPLSFTTDVPLAGASTEKGIRVMKYHPSVSDFDTRNYVLMRFGEAYLMRAEAMMRMGAAGALAEVNALRVIRGATVLAGPLTEADMLAERGRELYWEGYRRTDQVRFGTFTDTWSEKTVTDDFRVLYPIPAQALSTNPNLTQNPGY